MNIIEKNVADIIPYANNPRKNDDAVPFVAESIKQFGFKVPIVIDKDNVIVAGHTRHKAAKLLKLETVPCIVADDLSNEQVKAFRLADNKVSEQAEWDFELLDIELDDINIDMDMFGFSIEELPVEEQPKEVKLKTNFQIIIDCDDEQDMEYKFNMIDGMGIECRLSTL